MMLRRLDDADRALQQAKAISPNNPAVDQTIAMLEALKGSDNTRPEKGGP